MTTEERSLLQDVDRVLGLEQVHAQIRPIVERVRAELARKEDALMAWEPIALTLFGGALPAAIRSSWVFVLRAGANTGAERHPLCRPTGPTAGQTTPSSIAVAPARNG